MESFYTFCAIGTAIFIEAMPFLVIGALFSSAIEVFVSAERLLRLVPKSVAGGVLMGIGTGFVLPTCECGVVPVVRRLMRKGVPPYIAITYMLAAPIVNPVVLVSTYIAFRGSTEMVFARAAMAAITATVVGLYVTRIGSVLRAGAEETGCCAGHDCGHDHGGDHSHSHEQGHEGEPLARNMRAVLVHSANEFMDMGKFLIIGSFVAAAFKTYLPENVMAFFAGDAALSIGGMMLLAILLSVCSEADAFVAASFQTFSAASRLAFIAIGPMVDLKLIGMFAVTFRRRVVVALIVVPTLLIFVLSWAVDLLDLLQGVR